MDGQGCSGMTTRGNAFPHLLALVTLLEDLDYIEAWLRSHWCTSGSQIRTAGQKSTVEQEDPVWKFL